MSTPSRFKTRPRRTGGINAHPASYAWRALITAASTSAFDPEATVANASPVAGSMASNVFPLPAQARSPLTNMRPSTFAATLIDLAYRTQPEPRADQARGVPAGPKRASQRAP